MSPLNRLAITPAPPLYPFLSFGFYLFLFLLSRLVFCFFLPRICLYKFYCPRTFVRGLFYWSVVYGKERKSTDFGWIRAECIRGMYVQKLFLLWYTAECKNQIQCNGRKFYETTEFKLYCREQPVYSPLVRL